MWVDTQQELPEYDGYFETCNSIDEPYYYKDLRILLYDGYGFLEDKDYFTVKYWKKYIPEKCVKKYGKIKKDEK